MYTFLIYPNLRWLYCLLVHYYKCRHINWKWTAWWACGVILEGQSWDPSNAAVKNTFNALGTKWKHFRHLILNILSLVFMRPPPLLAMVVITIFHSNEPSQIFNKYCFLKIHIDLGLFTQVHKTSQRGAIVLCL